MQQAGTIAVVAATDEHVPALARFYQRVWDPQATAASVQASRANAARGNFAFPGIVPPTVIVTLDGEAVGHVGTLPARFWTGTTTRAGYWIKGLMVLEEHRNGPIGFLLMKEIVKLAPLSGAMVVAQPARRLFEALKYRDTGALANMVRILNGARLARRLDVDALGLRSQRPTLAALIRLTQRSGLAALGGGLASFGMQAGAAARRFGTAGVDSQPRGPDDAARAQRDTDHVWMAARESLGAAAVRDGAYLAVRYGEGPDAADYTVFDAHSRGRPSGFAVLRRPRAEGDPRLRGIAVATLSDIVYRTGDAATGLSLLGAVESHARALGADAVLCSASHPRLVSLLRRQSYLSAGRNVHFLFRDAEAGATGLPDAQSSWWLTRGDGSSDEVF